MKKYNFKIVGALVVFIFAFSVTAQAIEFGARGYYWWPELSGELRVNKGGVIGTKINVEDDLGIGDESYPSVEVFAGIGSHRISLIYTKADYSGDKYVSRDIKFAGETYTAHTLVRSDFDFTMIDLEYQYDFLNLENVLAGFSLSAIGKIKYIDAETRIRATSPDIDKSETLRAPVPMFGLGMHVGILADLLEARAKFSGIGYSGSKFYDGLIDLSVTPFPFLDIHGGYRFMKLGVDDISDVYTDIEFKGPYIGLTISF